MKLREIKREQGLEQQALLSLMTSRKRDAVELRRHNDRLEQLNKDYLAALERDSSTATPVLSSNTGSIESIGGLFTKSGGFTETRDRRKIAAQEFDRKAVLTLTGYSPQSIRAPEVISIATEGHRVSTLMPQGTTEQNAIVYMEETTFTNAAAAVAEGAAKPEATIGFTEKTAPVRKIAVTLPVTDELLNDVPALRSYIDARLITMLELTENAQLLSGSGVSPNIEGILTNPGIQTQAKGVDPISDAIMKAITLVATVGFDTATGIVMHPNDWQKVALERTTDGAYLWGPPSMQVVPKMWGLDIVTTTAQPAGTVLVGAFATSAQIFRRETISVEVSTEHSDFFVKNQALIRAEERLALAVYRPKGFAKVTGV